MYSGLARDLVEITVGICELKNELASAKSEIERLRKENAVLADKAAECGRAFADGKLKETAKLAAETERERLAKVFDVSADEHNERALRYGADGRYVGAASNASAASLCRWAAAECRKVPA